jgi:hypothetical protein
VSWVRRAWLWLTYWQVVCEVCNGTGICHQRNATEPHSCCGDCPRRYADPSELPRGWHLVPGTRPIVGTGLMWRRPWSRRQVTRP